MSVVDDLVCDLNESVGNLNQKVPLYKYVVSFKAVTLCATQYHTYYGSTKYSHH